MSTLTTPISVDRGIRQRDIVPAQRLADCHAWVIGVGAIGRQVALQLAAIGMPRITLFDDDQVQIENLAPQGYLVGDLGTAKVHSTAALSRQVNPSVEVTPIFERFKRTTARGLPKDQRLVVFLCVDSIQARKLIWESLCQQVSFFVDGRMSAEVLRVLAVASPPTDDDYATTLFQPEQAFVGSCTAKSTIYTANIAAGLMLGQFTRWLRRMPVDADVTLNLLSMELTVSLPAAA